MRLFLYELLTQGIIILGSLRKKLDLQLTIRRGRTFKNPPDMFYSIECCDCGLTHFRIADRGLEQPVRPRLYGYSWRHFAVKSSEFRKEEEW